MLIGIRVAFLGAMISAALGGSLRTSDGQSGFTLENKYVHVFVAPPRNEPAGIESLCTRTNPRPYVELFVRTRPVAEKQDSSSKSNERDITAGFGRGRGVHGCPFANDGTVITVNLDSRPGKTKFSDDAVRLDPTHNEVLMENDRVRVVRIHFEPGESGPIVDKRPRVIFVRTDSEATVTFPDGHSETRDMKAGTVSFGIAGRQATKNTGTAPLENIVVELKSKDSEKK